MTIINDLAAKKAYLVGQLNEVDGAESSMSRSQQMMKLWREFKQVHKQLEEAYEEAEAKGTQSSVYIGSVQEGEDPAAQTVSEDEADTETSDHSSPGNMAASSSNTASKAAPRKVAFQLPEASDHDSHSDISETSSTSSSIELDRDPSDLIDIEDGEALYQSLMARRQKYMRLDNDGNDASDHFVLSPHIGGQDKMEGSRISAESQEQDSS